MMNKKDFLYEILYKAFIVIREEAVNINNEKIFKISSYCHNLPDRLKNCKTDKDFEILFNEYKEDAISEGIAKWL